MYLSLCVIYFNQSLPLIYENVNYNLTCLSNKCSENATKSIRNDTFSIKKGTFDRLQLNKGYLSNNYIKHTMKILSDFLSGTGAIAFVA